MRTLLRIIPWLTLAAFMVPIAAGLLGTMLPALGYLPALGSTQFHLGPIRTLLALPGLEQSIRTTLFTGFVSTLLSLGLVAGFCSCTYRTALFSRVQVFLTPLLAAPHSAVAIGLAFLIAPSGWLARIVSPWLTGWVHPPDIGIPHDELGLSLIAGLLIKEVPYLLLMTLGALNQVPVKKTMTMATSMGYGPAMGWMKTIFPVIYPQIRLPIYAVLAFSLSVVDVAIILGPSNPPPLSTYVLRLFSSRDLAMQFPAAAGAMLQFGVVIGGILVWRGLERICGLAARPLLSSGHRSLRSRITGIVPKGAILISVALSLLGSLVLCIWSFTRVWRYPAPWPKVWTLHNWERHMDGLLTPATNTIMVGFLAVAIALVLTLGCLENEKLNGVQASPKGLWLIYTPLLIPQIAFLFGLQTFLVRLELDGTLLALVWSHLLFVLPYTFLSLADPWRSSDDRYFRTAACLGASPWRVFWRIKLPMLLKPVLFAVAVGFGVSAGEYLPTLFAGAGRFATLTTEAVTLASGSDRRIVGVYAFVQSSLPLLIYGLAFALPGWRAWTRSTHQTRSSSSRTS